MIAFLKGEHTVKHFAPRYAFILNLRLQAYCCMTVVPLNLRILTYKVGLELTSEFRKD